MPPIHQLSLFDRPPVAAEDRNNIDGESEQLLRDFAEVRLAEGASRRSVLRETSQLRSVLRECAEQGQPSTGWVLLTDLGRVARVLREPKTQISRSTGRARLLAVQRFIRVVGPKFERDPAADLAELDASLPAKPVSGWHTSGTLIAGSLGRRRSRGPTLDGADLYRIVAAAAGRTCPKTDRDRALVAVLCFSGIRPEEALKLRWEDIEGVPGIDWYGGLRASVTRGARRLRLPLPGPSAVELLNLRATLGMTREPPSGYVFRARHGIDRPLGYRAARGLLVRACRCAGLPPVEAAELRAGFAHWLRAHGLSEHEVATVLGLARVRSVDHLLARHAALDAQRRLREQAVG